MQDISILLFVHALFSWGICMDPHLIHDSLGQSDRPRQSVRNNSSDVRK